MPSETPLPTDVAELQARVLAAEAALAASEEARARLERMLASLRHAAYGARSEKRDPEQRNLPLEDLEIAEGMLEAAEERARATLKASRPAPSAVNRSCQRGRHRFETRWRRPSPGAPAACRRGDRAREHGVPLRLR